MFRRVVLAAVLTLATVVSGVVVAQQADRPAGNRAQWAMAFEDTFDGEKLNREVWTTCYWWNRRGCTNEGNSEEQWYTANGVRVDDGVLRLTARRRTVQASDGRQYPYTSGMVTTGRRKDSQAISPGFAFKYGRVSVRMRTPAGRGLWPAIWMLPVTHNSRPEIDILEVLGHAPARLHFHVHYWKDGIRRDPGKSVVGPNTSEGWHRYTLVWTPTRLEWRVDGKLRWTLTRPAAIPHQRMYLLINLAVGGEWPGSPDESTEFPATLEVDYVRIWTPGRR